MRIHSLFVIFAASLAAGILAGVRTSLLYNYSVGMGHSPTNERDPIRDEHLHDDNERGTDYTFTSISVLCFVMTSPENLFSKAIHVTRTWGPRCNRTLYVTETEPDRPFPGNLLVVPVQRGTGRVGIWPKTRAAFIHIFDHYHDQFEWFVKADDDTFLVVDNLRYFLSSKDSEEPVFYGYHLEYKDERFDIDYASGGGGYVVGRQVLRRFMGVVTDGKLCPPVCWGGAACAEDAAFGMCVKNAGVTIEGALDSLGRNRFLPLNPSFFMKGFETSAPWLMKISAEALQTGLNCCSDYLISMHYVDPKNLYIMEYLTQHFRRASQSRDHNYVVDGRSVPIEPSGVQEVEPGELASPMHRGSKRHYMKAKADGHGVITPLEAPLHGDGIEN